MKMLSLIVMTALLSSCALVNQVKDPEGYRAAHTPVDPYEKVKVKPGNIQIANEMSKPEKFAEYKKEICGEISDKACLVKYNETFYARLKEYYHYASMDELSQHCVAHPVECKNMAYVENVTIELFNMGIDEIKKRDIASAQEAERIERARVFQAMGAGFQQYNQQQYLQQQYQQQQPRPQLIYPGAVQTNCQTNGNITNCTSHR